MHWFGRSDIMLRQVIAAVSLCSVLVVCVCVWVWIRYRALLATCSCQSVFCFSRMCVHWFRSDIGLRRLLVAVSLCSVPVVCVCACIGLDQISGFVRYVWLSVCSVSVACAWV